MAFASRLLAFILLLGVCRTAGFAQGMKYEAESGTLTGTVSVMTTLAYFVGKVVSLEQLLAWVSKFVIVALGLAIAWIVVLLWLESRSAKASGD